MSTLNAQERDVLKKRGYEPHMFLGSGTYGKVYVLCESKRTRHHLTRDATRNSLAGPCQFAVKISQFTDPIEFETALLDQYFLEACQSFRIPNYLAKSSQTNKTSMIVPKLYNAWTNDNKKVDLRILEKKTTPKSPSDIKPGVFYITMDRFQGNVSKLTEAKSRSSLIPQHIRKSLEENNLEIEYVFFKSELKQMYAISKKLGELGIIHGDLKPDQFLFRQQYATKVDYKKPADVIVITDFGFSGKIQPKSESLVATNGWSSNSESNHQLPWSWGKPGRMPEIKSKSSAVLFNTWQLEANYFYNLNNVTLIIDLENSKSKYKIFAGIESLDKSCAKSSELKPYIPQNYFDYRNQLMQNYESREDSLPLFYL